MRLLPRPPALDTLGAGLATACAVHCGAMPWLAVGATAGLWAASETAGRAALAASVLLAAASCAHGLVGHRHPGPLALVGLALPCLLLGEFAAWSPVPAAAIAVLGGLTLAAAHQWNHRLRHRHAGAAQETAAWPRASACR